MLKVAKVETFVRGFKATKFEGLLFFNRPLSDVSLLLLLVLVNHGLNDESGHEASAASSSATASAHPYRNALFNW
jgi:hypothetical protein